MTSGGKRLATIAADVTVPEVSRMRRLSARNRSISPSILGLATGFKDLDQGLGLDVVPGVSVTHSKSYVNATSETDTEPSVDLYYRITPALTGSLTINTDFSATVVDVT